jgi:hypothetical protein
MWEVAGFGRGVRRKTELRRARLQLCDDVPFVQSVSSVPVLAVQIGHSGAAVGVSGSISLF